MSGDFASLTAATSAIVAVATGAAQAVFLQRSANRVGEDLAALDEQKLTAVLERSNVSDLSKYVLISFGDIDLADYVRKPDLKRRSDAVIDRIVGFVGTYIEEPVPDQATSSFSPTSQSLPYDVETQKISQEVSTGEVWNALARLRRYIELRLRDALQLSADDARANGASALLRITTQRRLLAPDDSARLRYAIQVANRGVHGEVVERDQAQEAFEAALVALSHLREGLAQ